MGSSTPSDFPAAALMDDAVRAAAGIGEARAAGQSAAVASVDSREESEAPAPRAGFYCHSCQSSIEALSEDGACPRCHGHFVEEDSPSLDGFRGIAITRERLARQRERVRRVREVLQTVLQGLLEAHQPTLRGAPESALKAIRVMEFERDQVHDQQAPMCVICHMDFEAGETLGELPGCRHTFHDACVREWLARADTCPVCRSNVADSAGSSTVQESPSSGSGEGGEIREPRDDTEQRSRSRSRSARRDRLVPASVSQAAEAMASVSQAAEALAAARRSFRLSRDPSEILHRRLLRHGLSLSTGSASAVSRGSQPTRTVTLSPAAAALSQLFAEAQASMSSGSPASTASDSATE
eukprot:gnl/TRDRNA2_/TRDRNA2_192857_c0_seq1.p1 gnl/TRDRNA2_/TRDRNA2_192857_c0~~gnl/TRDRNA2_/TRDRNA2_192857_c0_seq1.p1  ORF type:complete len:354 (-),score=59.95 gnl/TRDRNA2_/TRDRNA2_192857_c0_seq1:54-1115(-)